MNFEAMKSNEMKNRVADWPFIWSAADPTTPVEPGDLSRFEGEGGLEAPMPAVELIDIPLESAIWRRPRPAAPQTHQTKITP